MFLHPLMLLGLGAVALPVVVHLLSRGRPQRMPWAAMRFLTASIQQNQRRLRLQDLLLLFLRCALVALLALVLARPVLPAAGGSLGRAATTAVVILDHSASMSATDGIQTRLVTARAAAGQILEWLPEGSTAAAVLASDIARPLIPEPSADLRLVAARLAEAPLVDRGSDLLPALRAATETLAGRTGTQRDIYILTDGQASAFRHLSAIRQLLEDHGQDLRAHFLLVGGPLTENLAVSALGLEPGILAVGRAHRVEVRVRNCGTAEVRQVHVTLAVDDDPPMDQGVIAVIGPGEERGLVLTVRFRTEGFHTLTARVPPDHLPADDQRTLAVRVGQNVRVLLVDGDPGAEPRDSEVFYLAHALQPVPRARRDEDALRLVAKPPADLPGLRLEDFDAIVLANVTDLPDIAVGRLGDYVRRGHGLWLFPGDKVNAAFYNQALGQAGLLPARLGAILGNAGGTTWTSLSDRELTHPIVNLWTDAASGALSSGRIFRWVMLAPEPQAQVVARLADGSPAIVQRDVGLGRVLLWCTTADTAWNDLGARAGIFVPLCQRALGHLVAAQDERLTIPTGSTFSYPGTFDLLERQVRITKRSRPWGGAPDGGEEVAESRRIDAGQQSTGPDGGLPLITFESTDFAGAYDVAAESLHLRFAAQGDLGESNLDMVGEEQLASLAQVATVVRWAPGTSPDALLRNLQTGSDPWLALAVLLLAAAAGEMVAAHWFSKPR